MRKLLWTGYVAAVWTLLVVTAVLLGLMFKASFQVKAADGDTEVALSLFGVPMITAWREGSEMGAAWHRGAYLLLLVPLVVGMAAAATQAIIRRKTRNRRRQSRISDHQTAIIDRRNQERKSDEQGS